jgi:hypothetical protein
MIPPSDVVPGFSEWLPWLVASWNAVPAAPKWWNMTVASSKASDGVVAPAESPDV